MKMKHFVFGALAMGSVFFMASCDKDVESTSLQVNLATTIPVKGYVYANLNDRTAGLEFAPEGTLINFSVYYDDLMNNYYSNNKWIESVLVGANGEFTVDVPVIDGGVNLYYEPVTFEYDKVLGYGANGTDPAAVSTEMRIYYKASTSVAVSTTNNPIIQITYTDKAFDNTALTTKLTLTVKAELDESLAGTELVVGQKVILYNSGWTQEYTTDAKGEIMADVPYNVGFTATMDFNTLKKVSDGNGAYENITYNYKLDTGLGYFTTPTLYTVTITGETEVEN